MTLIIAQTETLVVPLVVLLALLGPLYGLLGGMYILLFRHTNKRDIHLDTKKTVVTTDLCDQTKEVNQREHTDIKAYISSVDNRAAAAVSNLSKGINEQFDRLFKLLEKVIGKN